MEEAVASENARERARKLQSEIELFLRTSIEAQEFGAGDKLPTERELAIRFSANRSVVRGALAQLTQEGLVYRQSGSGTFVSGSKRISDKTPSVVPHVSPSDILEARRVLEVGYLSLVAARATDADFEKMAVELHAMETASEQIAFRQAGYRFHMRVAEATRNPLLITMQELVMVSRAAAGWSTVPSLNDTQELRTDQIVHLREIMEALRLRDSEKAAKIAAFELGKLISKIISPITSHYL